MLYKTIRKAAQSAASLAKCTGSIETSVSLNNTWKVKVRRVGDHTIHYIADGNGYSYGGIISRYRFVRWARWFMGKGGA